MHHPLSVIQVSHLCYLHNSDGDSTRTWRLWDCVLPQQHRKNRWVITSIKPLQGSRNTRLNLYEVNVFFSIIGCMNILIQFMKYCIFHGHSLNIGMDSDDSFCCNCSHRVKAMWMVGTNFKYLETFQLMEDALYVLYGYWFHFDWTRRHKSCMTRFVHGIGFQISFRAAALEFKGIQCLGKWEVVLQQHICI